MNKRIKKVMMVLGAVFLGLFIFTLLYVQLPMFGQLPQGKYQEKIEKSKNFRKGKFHNIEKTLMRPEDVSVGHMMLDFLFKGSKNKTPKKPLPTIKTDLKNLDLNEDILVWFGHSSAFIQIDGKRFLIDPVLSKTASPIPFYVRAFKGTDIYDPEDMPNVDYVLITHDHYDHLDMKTIKKISSKTGKFICGLGVGAHLRRWGIDPAKITELDWEESIRLGKEFKLSCLPARHFSGRSLFPNRSLWVSFAVTTPTFSFYISGDSGYGIHYKKIGETFKSFDLVLMDSGQYDNNWRYIHENPSEVIKATTELNAKVLLPVHVGKFCISSHAWNEPLIKLSEESKGKPFKLITPMIGEKVRLKDGNQKFQKWWDKN